ncbi:DUF4268 domain-containing protein [Crocinitomicaceae bacterium]|nr:DUF4268 domain-containing protein [Crocinitomicaceae bacterium]
MLSKEERRALNTAFWDGFRKEMRNIKSVNGRGINWINYPSDVKDIYIRLEADHSGARVCVDIQPKDDSIRSILWEQFTELRTVMEKEVGVAEWNEFDRVFQGRNVSRVSWNLKDANFYQEDGRLRIKDFLRSKLVQFDAFYQEYKEILILLAE